MLLIMKKAVLFFLCILLNKITQAQLANGSTAPDFTFTDINGVSQHLYTYLNQGKYVAIDVSTTWCEPCWNYHSTGTMDSLYNLHDVGDRTWKILFIEADGGTDSFAIHGIGSSTLGDWTWGTLFPIINPSSGVPLNDFLVAYDLSVWPTFFLICPNKKVYQDTLNAALKPTVSTWQYVASQYCAPAGLDNIADVDPLTIYPNPSSDYVTLYFTLNNSRNVSLSVTNIMGTIVANRNFGSLQAGDQSLRFDVDVLAKGLYTFTVSDNSGRYIRKKIMIK
jgi:hypothetical protein